MTNRAAAFTLIELMIAVAIIGVLASVAIPAYSGYVMSARGAELPQNLATMYQGMQTYWNRPFQSQQGIASTAASHCVLDDGGYNGSSLPPLMPTPYKRSADFSVSPSFSAIGFAPPGGLYGCYSWKTQENFATCGVKESDFHTPVVYSAFAVTDLDGDGILGGYVMFVGIHGEELYRQPGWSTVADAFPVMGFGTCGFCSAGFID